MDVSKQQELFKIIELALAQTKEQRTQWLKEHSPTDLYRKAVALLQAAEVATIGVTGIDFDIDFGRHEDYLGQRIGAYELTELIGEGGMGYVFLAQRVDGTFEQKVAIKLIRVAMSGTTLVKKFERERQILSDLNHPNIAALYDGGTTQEGVPYLVMEYVEGVSIDQYIENHQLSLKPLLELFVKICSAVRAAHRSLIIHRDIKPANILVGADGQPKLLDFGIARSIDPVSAGAEKTQLVQLTPTYASPEQIRDEVLTTATDVYSLGVVLFEALTGELPYEVTGLSAFQAEQLITNAAQPTPSRKSRSYLTLKSSLQRNELDAIVLKSLALNIDRRYESAGALMNDLRRFLNSQPVEAQLDTPAYRFRKLVTRNKGAALASLVAVMALAGGLTISLIQTHKAKKELARAEAVGGYLRNILLSPEPAGDSPMRLGPDATIHDLLLAAEQALENDLTDQPVVKIELYSTLSTAQMWMNDMDAALRTTRKAVELASNIKNADNFVLMEAMHVLGTVLEDDFQGEAAAQAYKESLAMAIALGPKADDMQLVIRNDLAVTYGNMNQWKKALNLQQEAMTFLNRQEAPDTSIRTALLGNFGHFQFENGYAIDGERNLRAAIKLSTDLADASYYRLRSKQRLARLLDFTGRFSEAIIEYQQCIDQADLKHVETEEEIVTAQLRIAIIHIQQKHIDQARKLIEDLRIQFYEYLGQEESWMFHQADAVLQLADQNYANALSASQRARDFSLAARQPLSERIRIDLLSARALVGMNRRQDAELMLNDIDARTLKWLGPGTYLAKEIAGLRNQLAIHD